MVTNRCNQLVDGLILIAHMVSINESISLGNALLTLGMSAVYQSRILQSILCTRNSVDPDVPTGDLEMWEFWSKGVKVTFHTRELADLTSLFCTLSHFSHAYTHSFVFLPSRRTRYK